MFLTNHRELAASTIAALYRQRWQIELFFQALKQNVGSKTFVGTSANARQIQIGTAWIARLVLQSLQRRARFGGSRSHLAALLHPQWFVSRDLFAWIDEPFQPPPQRAHPPSRFHFFGQLTWTAERPTSTPEPMRKPQIAPIFFSPVPRLRRIWTTVFRGNSKFGRLSLVFVLSCGNAREKPRFRFWCSRPHHPDCSGRFVL